MPVLINIENVTNIFNVTDSEIFFVLYIIHNFFSALEAKLEAIGFALLVMVLSEMEVKLFKDRDMPRELEDASILMMLHLNS